MTEVERLKAENAALLKTCRDLRHQLSKARWELVEDQIEHWKSEYEIQRGIIREMLHGKTRDK